MSWRPPLDQGPHADAWPRTESTADLQSKAGEEKDSHNLVQYDLFSFVTAGLIAIAIFKVEACQMSYLPF
jgi:hypothetical protein